MRSRTNLSCVLLLPAFAILVGAAGAFAQQNVPHIALKGGESAVLRNFFFITNCQSVLTGPTEVEVLEGPDEVILTIRDEMVLPRAYNCPKPVPGGVVVATAREVTETKEGKLTFRLKFSTKMGERQNSNTYIVSLFPGASSTGASMRPGPSTNPGAESSQSASPH
jgi:hypothetical protein